MSNKFTKLVWWFIKNIFNKTVNESNSNTKTESESDNESDYKSDEGEKDKYFYEIS